MIMVGCVVRTRIDWECAERKLPLKGVDLNSRRCNLRVKGIVSLTLKGSNMCLLLIYSTPLGAWRGGR